MNRRETKMPGVDEGLKVLFEARALPAGDPERRRQTLAAAEAARFRHRRRVLPRVAVAAGLAAAAVLFFLIRLAPPVEAPGAVVPVALEKAAVEADLLASVDTELAALSKRVAALGHSKKRHWPVRRPAPSLFERTQQLQRSLANGNG